MYKRGYKATDDGYKKSYSKGRVSRTKKPLSKYKGFARTTGAYKRFDSKSYLPPGITRELKFFQACKVLTTVDNNGAPMSSSSGTWCNIEQGVGASQREGRKIVISEINMRCFFDVNAATTANSHNHRFLLVLDTQCNGAAFTVAEILNTTALTVLGNVWAAKNHYNGERFKFLLDESWTSDCIETAAPAAQNSHQIVKSLKVAIPIIYNESLTDGTITTIKQNNIMAWYLHNGDGTSSALVNYELRYYDD